MRTFIAAMAALAAWVCGAAHAQSFNAQEQSEIRAIVRDYLVRNPEVLQEAIDAMQERASAERRREIENDRRDFSLGPADAPITVVEFFDYRCPYCHAALDWVKQLAAGRRDVRIVFKELPVLGPESLEASRAALAAMRQGRYWQFHQELMAFRGDLNSSRIDELARRSGVDVTRMRRDMDSEDITALLEKNHNLAYGAGVSGTPGFLIEGELVSGFDRDALERALREAGRRS